MERSRVIAEEFIIGYEQPAEVFEKVINSAINKAWIGKPTDCPENMADVDFITVYKRNGVRYFVKYFPMGDRSILLGYVFVETFL